MKMSTVSLVGKLTPVMTIVSPGPACRVLKSMDGKTPGGGNTRPVLAGGGTGVGAGGTTTLPGRQITCPTLIRLGLGRLLICCRIGQVVPFARAIRNRFSPGRTICDGEQMACAAARVAGAVPTSSATTTSTATKRNLPDCISTFICIPPGESPQPQPRLVHRRV